ncbi:hypothetical protein MMC12_005447 [Toensbergia leucococca]|nr:hypothetical protein [Toensbergia leucococca]
MSDRKTGTVKWLNDEKGYGLITPDDGSDNLDKAAQSKSANDDGAFAYITLDEGMEALLAVYADIDIEGCTTLEINQAVTYVTVNTLAALVARNV